MARIRTIKPEFFTSEDIVSLTPLARVFYIALWCEADREGRMDWKPGTLKMRYLPGDSCDVKELAQELIDSGLIVLYEVGGKQYAEIPTFKNHQVINNRESESTRPARNFDASQRVKAERKEGKEGNGNGRKEGEASPTGSRLPADWVMTEEMEAFCKTERPDLVPSEVACRFSDYWYGVAGKDGRKADWMATWRNWVRREKKQPVGASNQAETAYQRSMRERMQEAAPDFARKAPSKPVENVIDFFAIEVPAKRLEIGNEPSSALG